MPPLSEADHQVRATGIGSSDISAIVGENPWANAHNVWQRKLNLVPPFPETNATRLGHDMEPIIGRWYTRDTGRILRKGGGTKRHKDRSWQLCTIDFGFAKGERRIVECKHVGHYASAGWTMEADGAPPYVQIQAQWQMGVLGYERADVAVIFGGNADFRIYEYSFDATMFGHLTELGQVRLERRQRVPVREAVLEERVGDDARARVGEYPHLRARPALGHPRGVADGAVGPG